MTSDTCFLASSALPTLIIIVAIHLSYLDAALLATYFPSKLTFAINTQVAQHWLVRPFLKLIETFPLDPTNPMAAKSLIESIKDKNHVVIFPEGRITVTGGSELQFLIAE